VATIVVVVGDPAALTAGDTAVIDRLQSVHGHTVVIRDDSLGEYTQPYDGFMILDSCVAGTVLGKYAAEAKPGILLENGPWDEHGLCTASSQMTGVTQWVLDAAPPFSGGLSGTVTMFSASSTQSYALTANLPAGADIVATVASDATRAVCVAYEAGATTTTGTAPARRVAMGVHNTAAGLLTASAFALLDAAIAWAFPAALVSATPGTATGTGSASTPTATSVTSALDLQLVGSSDWAYGGNAAGNPAPLAYPAGIAERDVVYLVLHNKSDPALTGGVVLEPPDQDGWTKVATAVGGGGTFGVDAGPTRITLYKRIAPAGGLSGVIDVSMSGNNSLVAVVRAYRAVNAGANVQYSEDWGSFSRPSASTAMGGTIAPELDLATKDRVAFVLGSTNDTQVVTTGPTIAASGATFGTITKSPNANGAGTSGNDVGAAAWDVPVTAGASSTGPTITATASVSATGIGFAWRVRATNGSSGGGTNATPGTATGTGSAGAVTATTTGTGDPLPANPGEALWIGDDLGKNHFEVGIGDTDALHLPDGWTSDDHDDYGQTVIEGGFSETNKFYLLPNGNVVFRIGANDGRTSEGTQHPRSELRELNEAGAKISWNGTSGVHRMKGRSRITHVAFERPWICFFQIHDASSDLVRVQTEGDPGATTGLEIVARRTPPGGSEIRTVLRTGYSVGTWISWEIEIDAGRLRIWLDGVVVLDVTGMGTSGCYYKTGCYLQTNTIKENGDASQWGAVEMEAGSLQHWHTGWATPTEPVFTGAPSNIETRRFYFSNTAPLWVPGVASGYLDDVTALSGARQLTEAPAGAATSRTVAETSAENPWWVLLGQWVSHPAAQAGVLDIAHEAVLGFQESSADANLNATLTVWVTQGATSSRRGTAVNRFYGELPTTASGLQLTPSGTVASESPVSFQRGDRIVIEVVYRATTTATTSYSGTVHYGGTGTPDLAAGVTTLSRPGWIDLQMTPGIVFAPGVDAAAPTAVGSGTAQGVSPNVSAAVGTAAGSGSAGSVGERVTAGAGSAGGTGSAGVGAPLVAAAAGAATAAGSAAAATATKSVRGTAGAATGSGTAGSARAGVAAAASLAAGAGSADGVRSAPGSLAPTATGTGAALGVTAIEQSAQPVGGAVGVGSAGPVQGRVAATPATATGSGAAGLVAKLAAAPATAATGTATAAAVRATVAGVLAAATGNGAAGTVGSDRAVSPAAEVAEGQGVAGAAAGRVAAAAGTAQGSGTAAGVTATAVPAVYAHPPTAAAAGAAGSPQVAVQARAPRAGRVRLRALWRASRCSRPPARRPGRARPARCASRSMPARASRPVLAPLSCPRCRCPAARSPPTGPAPRSLCRRRRACPAPPGQRPPPVRASRPPLRSPPRRAPPTGRGLPRSPRRRRSRSGTRSPVWRPAWGRLPERRPRSRRRSPPRPVPARRRRPEGTSPGPSRLRPGSGRPVLSVRGSTLSRPRRPGQARHRGLTGRSSCSASRPPRPAEARPGACRPSSCRGSVAGWAPARRQRSPGWCARSRVPRSGSARVATSTCAWPLCSRPRSARVPYRRCGVLIRGCCRGG
jgi:hypothetical protein